MTTLIPCAQCGREMHSSGFNGLCARCVFARTTSGFRPAPESQAAATQFKTGLTVGPHGRFLLLDKIGEGGMGEVWLADDRELSTDGEPHFVALKFLSERIRADQAALAALRTEVKQLECLVHPHIVRVHDLHTTADGMPFFKMEYLDGSSLDQWLEHNGAMPWRLVRKLAQQVASALAYAHDSRRLLHRDIKPGNLLLGEASTVKLTDFGIATAIRPHAQSRPSGMLGTLVYASPQLLAGNAATPADDIYALGITLYELLAGAPPFLAETAPELTARIQAESAAPLLQRLRDTMRNEDIPVRFVTLVHRCISRDVRERPTAAELAQLLAAIPEPSPLPDHARWKVVHESEGWDPVAVSPRPRRTFIPALLLLLFLGAAAYFSIDAVRARKFLPGEQAPALASPASVGADSTASSSEPAAQADPAPPPDPGSNPGYLLVVVEGNPELPHEVWLSGPGATEEVNLRAGISRHFFGPRRPGTWQVRGREPRYAGDVLATNQIVSGRTNLVELRFERVDIALETDPADVYVTWPEQQPGLRNSVDRTPASIKMHGNILVSFRFEKVGYEVFETNFFTADEAKLRVTLVRSRQPAFDHLHTLSWTNSLEMPFVWINHTANAQNGFYACLGETTVSQFEQFAAQTAFTATELWSITTTNRAQVGRSWREPGFAQSPGHPVVGVTLQEAIAFCRWLTDTEIASGRLRRGQSYRLPTTNEWLLLTGATPFPWGPEPQPRGNFSGTEVRGLAGSLAWPDSFPVLENYRDDFPRTAPVYHASFLSSALGFYHLGGNVAEWAAEGVTCGGSWFDGEVEEEMTTRDLIRPANPGQADDRIGFRVILAQE